MDGARTNTRLDDLLETLSPEDRWELARRVRVGSLTLHVGDRVEARRQLRGSYPHADLEAEEGWGAEPEDYCVPYHVPAGTLGRVTLVRTYITPFPYGVVFDSGPELSLAEGDIVRVTEQPSENERERNDALWTGCDVVQRPRHDVFQRPQLMKILCLLDVLKWPRGLVCAGTT